MSERRKNDSKRIIATDPGLMTPEELLACQGGRRKSLAMLIAQHKKSRMKEENQSVSIVSMIRNKIKWFLDTASLRISVRLKGKKIVVTLLYFNFLISNPLSISNSCEN